MNTGGSSGWLDRLFGACITLLFGAFALYCAVQLLASIWPRLVAIVGTGALIAVAVVVYRTTQNRW
ncbi:hypothetical protein DDT46_22655 [Mycobacteroides abscessus]|uniref:Transmembrane protein n=1 Tax=Mycobacteroides abscessus TaxID=36809 RepID=A0ABD7HHD8_9MYCO|nr:hypothetical protein [Mycobacteroides abscessus]AWG66310.1 hypothetical protein DDT46_22655 [Mycobacteroides abscessus]RIT29542.1 hypothetical protein D2E76_25200 [Mycobacteroides abscessus]